MPFTALGTAMADVTVRTSKKGQDYLDTVLREKKLTITRARFVRIEHKTQPEGLCLHIGRYKKVGRSEVPESEDPKSHLTLDEEETKNLVDFIENNHAPLKAGERSYIPLEGALDPKTVQRLRQIFQDGDKQRVLDLIADNDLLPEEILQGVQHRKRMAEVAEFRRMLDADLVEHRWQTWLQKNSWVLGTDFVRVLDERAIDPDNITDYLMQAYDGFLDIVEIKRPGGGLRFWSATRDHRNLVPSTDLTKAITQALGYLYEVERQSDSNAFRERVQGVEVTKPRCVLVFGRSNDWGDDERRAYRILNSSYHSLTIMTYDHVLSRAERMLSPHEDASGATDDKIGDSYSQDLDDEIPF